MACLQVAVAFLPGADAIQEVANVLVREIAVHRLQFLRLATFRSRLELPFAAGHDLAAVGFRTRVSIGQRTTKLNFAPRERRAVTGLKLTEVQDALRTELKG